MGHIFLHSYVSDIRLWRMTVYSLGNRWQHCQATSFMSGLDHVHFPVSVANCISPVGSNLNSYPKAATHCKPALKVGLKHHDLLTKTQQLLTAISHFKKR
jgi:hypothetical protein